MYKVVSSLHQFTFNESSLSNPPNIAAFRSVATRTERVALKGRLNFDGRIFYISAGQLASIP